MSAESHKRKRRHKYHASDIISESELQDIMNLANEDIRDYIQTRIDKGRSVKWSDINMINIEIGMKYIDKLNWDNITKNLNPMDSEDDMKIINTFPDNINWDILSENQFIPLDIITQFSDRINWEIMASHNHMLTRQFILDNLSKFNLMDLSLNEHIQSDPQFDVEYIEELIRYYKPERPELLEIIENFMANNETNITEDFVNKYMDVIMSHDDPDYIWEIISHNIKLSNEFIDKFNQQIRWDMIIENKLSPEILYKYQDRINWKTASKTQKIPEDLIIKYADKVDWKDISKYQTLSEDFLLRYKDKLDWVLVIRHQKNLSDIYKREHGHQIFTKPIIIPTRITYQDENDECPDSHKPVNGECVEPFPFKFKTINGQDCCYKKLTKSKFKFSKIRNLNKQPYKEGIQNGGERTCPNLHCQLFPSSGCTAYMKNSNFMKELYLRSIPYDPENQQEACKALQMEMPSVAWLYEQKDYTSSLSEIDRKWIKLYTLHGDRVLNGYLRGKPVNQETVEYIQDRIGSFRDFIHDISIENITEFLIRFNLELSRIIRNAPVLHERIVLYRGIENADFFVGTANHIYTNKGYVSTSVSSLVALSFSAGSRSGGYINRIIIPPGYSCLVLFETYYENEFEILLPTESMYYITQSFKPKTTLGSGVVQMNECVVIKTF